MAELTPAAPRAFTFDGQSVITNTRAAEVFDVETRLVTQAIKTNPEKFDHFSRRYAFELTPAEAESLRSAALISNAGRGGSRASPWLLTRKGVLRLATILKTPKAVEAVDTLIDVFDEVAEQVLRGQTSVTVSQPARLIAADSDERAEAEGFRRRLRARLEDLMDTVIDRQDHLTVRDAIAATSADTYSALRAFLEKGALQNERTAAETQEILERIRDLFERRMSDLQDAAIARERAAVQIAREKIDLIERSLDLSRRLEPGTIAEIAAAFLPALNPPDRG